jgi:type IV pilus assembly protein PilY1
MNAPYRCPPKLAGIALSVAGALGFASPVESGTLTLATEPLGTATSSIKPNVMFILDDSGSMFREYMPDYVAAPSAFIPGTAACFDTGDTGDGETSGSITGTINQCVPGDPPYMSPDFNTIYYNPAIYYRPGVNHDGTQMPVQDALNTADWTKVRTDEYNVENYHQLVDTNFDTVISSAEATAAAADFVDLATGYPDRVWCTSTADPATGGNCRQNSAYIYPNFQFPFGTTNGTAPKYVATSPYYYRIQTAQYCKTDGTDCKSGSGIVPGTHTLQAVEYCTDSELTNCAVGSAVTASHVFSGVRWCSDAGTLQSCQRKKVGSFIHAKHLGTTVTQTGTFAAVANEGQITVTSVNPGGGTINSITIGGVSVISGPIAVPAGSSLGTAASLIASAIQAHASSPDFNAAATGANAIITQAVAGSAGNGATILVSTTGTPTAQAKGTITIASVTGNTVRTISSITVGSTQLLCTAGTVLSYGSNVTVAAGTADIVAAGGWNTAQERSSVMVAIADRIATCALGGGYSATKTGAATVEVRAPLALGSSANGLTISVTGTSLSGFGVTPLAGGAESPTIGTSVTTMSGGADAFTGTRAVRIGVGKFLRNDIIPSVNAYAKVSTRTDCLGASCTYEEEMTNFANWYTYYRSRLKMMKTAAGRAFTSVDDTYRVGFITINPGSTVSSTKYLRVADFTTGAGGHKEAWYAKFYGQSAGGFTPLRQALSRVGWLFAGQLNTGLTSGIPTTDDPMTASCQPNFAILSTDGYWFGNPDPKGKDLSNVDMGNQDNVDAGYSTRASGAFDGNLSSTVATDTTAGGSGTLADVAMYYYKTDLRTSGSFATNNVPITNKDGNAAQHMVTFALGLGLDGQLTYRSDYETASSGDFADIKSGIKNWPLPQGNTPTALDDLWHAAVNGRGVFFSAKDPETLATALLETLAGMQTRIGAGAAAATSNLQPVAGDNFAFTAQYQTSDWIGDLKAKTIDLSSGIVSSVTLWSAASLLDLQAHTDRKIFTHDPSDSAGNLMKHLCWPLAGGANCSDGSGLTLAEQAYFDPTLLVQYPFGSDAGKLATVSAEKVLNFFRGERTYEDSGGGAPTDLFRLRDSILGDVINAQPAYVKKSPFSYGDTGYAEFKACTEGTGSSCPAGLPRRGTVFAASNDGFLHAFETDVNNNPYFQTAGIGTDVTSDDDFTGNNTGNGVERWAYVPGLVLPNVYKLANKPYSHRYFTDGSPQVGDICISTPCAGVNDWRTILVAGLNSGGIGYYALDITNPLSAGMKVLWEFTNRGICYTDAEIALGDKTSDCHLGLSYGNPLITKIKTGPLSTDPGKWVVIVTSGYNNTVSGGDGKGYLYILEAHTGKILHRLSTGVGTAASPSGLAKINGWATSSNTDNTVLAVYGGDLEGNLWRFGVDPVAPGNLTVVKVAAVTSAGGVAQPITVKPELGPVPNQPSDRMILFGTGKFLENTDKTDLSDQTIYALKDVPSVTTSPVITGGVRSNSLIKVRQFAPYSTSDSTRTVASGTAPSWSTDFGWLLDLPEDGERVNVDPQLQLGTLVVASNVPSGDTCTAGGFSWLNFLDYATGSYVPGATDSMASTKFASSLAVGINVIMLPGGKVVTIVTTADNQQLTQNTPVPSSSFAGRRVSWRELIKE